MRILILFTLLTFSIVGYAANIKFTLMGQQPNHIIQTAIKALATENIDISENSPYLNAKVQLLRQGHPYLIVYLLNKHNFGVRTIRIDMEDNYQVIYPLQLNYQLTSQDTEAPFASFRTTCPDPKVDLVLAAPIYDDLGNFLHDVVDAQYQTALKQGFKVATLLGPNASVQNYKNWLSCPNLKAFASIGHGNPSYIVLSDGALFYDYFQNTARFKKNTIVAFNSCEVFNNPMKAAMINSAQAQQFYGGRNSISIVGSTPTYGCMWDGVLKGANIRKAFINCVLRYDPYVKGSRSPIYLSNFTKDTLVVVTNQRKFEVTAKQLIGAIDLSTNEFLQSIYILDEMRTICGPVDSTVGLRARELSIVKTGDECKVVMHKYDPRGGDEDIYGLEGLGEEYIRRK